MNQDSWGRVIFILIILALITMWNNNAKAERVRTLKKGHFEIVMNCTRWAQLYHAESKLGIERFRVWFDANRLRFTQNDKVFITNDIEPLIRSRGGKPISFAQAMYHCGEEWM